MIPTPQHRQPILLSARERLLLHRCAPANPDQLHALINTLFAIHVPRKPLLPNSTAPFDYITHAFFETPPTHHTPRDCIVWASRGSGKTFYAALATALDLLFKPSIEIKVLAGSLEQAQRLHAHLRTFFDRPDLAECLESPPTQRRTLLKTGSVVELLTQSQTSVRGSRPQRLRCDEVDLFDPEIWEAAQFVTRSKRCGEINVRAGIEAISTWHQPGAVMDKLIRAHKDAPSPPTRLFRWTTIDTLAHCPESRPCEPCPLLPECNRRAKRAQGHIEIDDAIAIKSRASKRAWQSEMLCDEPTLVDAVFPEFSRARHVVHTDPPKDATHLAGMDFGFRAPTVVLFACLTPDDTLHIVDMYSATETILDRHADAILDSPYPNPEWIAVDPAGRQRNDQTGISAVALLAQRGLTVRSRPSSINMGISALRARLDPASGPPRLTIHPRCADLIAALERYHYPRNQPLATTPAKDGPDHAIDALRYLVVNLDHPYKASITSYL